MSGPTRCDACQQEQARFMVSDMELVETKAYCLGCEAMRGLALALTVLPPEALAEAIEGYAAREGVQVAEAIQDASVEAVRKTRRRATRATVKRTQEAQDAALDAVEREREQAVEGIAEGATG